MVKVNSIEDIYAAIRTVRTSGKEFTTNFFPDEIRINIWIRYGQLYLEDHGDTILFIRKNITFNNLFYVTANIEALKHTFVYRSHKDNTLNVIDIVGKQDHAEALCLIFTDAGFYRYTELFRMSRTGHKFGNSMNSLIQYADETQVQKIHDLLLHFFDPIAEQLPMMEEILNWITTKSILIYAEDMSHIMGFLIYELHGQTSYLRYWFVHPDHRDKKIGSALLNRYLDESRNTFRQLFWVIGSNDNAIKRYKHYGFRNENLHDIIMTNKNLKYG
jgi:ribosomal protein S18 acetylase RimI-like enzyme